MSWDVDDKSWRDQPAGAPADQPLDETDARAIAMLIKQAPAAPAVATAPPTAAPPVAAPAVPAPAAAAPAVAAPAVAAPAVAPAAEAPAVAAAAVTPPAAVAPAAVTPPAAVAPAAPAVAAPAVAAPAVAAPAAAAPADAPVVIPPLSAPAAPEPAPADQAPSGLSIPSLLAPAPAQAPPTAEAPAAVEAPAAEGVLNIPNLSGTSEPAAEPEAPPEESPAFVIPSLSRGTQPDEAPAPAVMSIPSMVAAPEAAPEAAAPEAAAPEAATPEAAAAEAGAPEVGAPSELERVDSSELELLGDDEESEGLVMPTLSQPAGEAASAAAPAPDVDDAGGLVMPTLTAASDEAAPADPPPTTEAEELAGEVEEIDVEDVEAEAIDLDSVDLVEVDQPSVPAPPPAVEAKQPPAPPPEPKQVKRRKGWYDDVFAEHFLFLASPTAEHTAQRDAEFIHAQLGLDDEASVLDVGCGDGRHAIALGRLGLKVTGLDNSLALLLAAAQNKDLAEVSDQHVDFVHGDMRRLPRDRKFDAVMCVGTTLGYFEEEQNRLCLQEMVERLDPGGRLLLHVFNRDFVVPHLPSRSWWQGRRCMVIDEAEMNFFANRLRIHRTVIFDDGRQYEHYMFMRAYTVQDLGKAVSALGMRVLEVSGSRDTRGRFYGAASPDIWIVAERK